MKIVKAYRFRLKTNVNIESKLEQFAGNCRFVWNKVLEINLARLNSGFKIMRYNESSFWLTLWKSTEEYAFLNNCPSQAMQQKLKDLDRAFGDCFDKKQRNKKRPKWRKKQLHNSFRYPQGFKISGNRVFLPKIGWVVFFSSRKVVGEQKNLTISKEGKYWFMSVQTEYEQEQQTIQNSDKEVGIDLGVSRLITLSDGRQVNSINAFKDRARKLSKAQKKLKLKRRFSGNWKKQMQKVRGVHRKISNIRKDYTHKLTTEICKNHAVIYVEALKIANMTKSAKGTQESPGTNVRAKSGLNRAILDQGWGELIRQLKYKSLYFGSKVVEINPKYTSQTCSRCGYVHKENRKSQSAFECISCNYTQNADLNAAKNILAAGQVVTACGEIAKANSMKQEPVVEAIQLPLGKPSGIFLL